MTTKRAHFSCRCRQHPSQQRDYGHLAKLQTGGGDAASEGRQVILERASDFFDQPVFAKTSRHRRHLPAADRKALLKIPVAKSRHVGAAIDDRPEKVQVGSGKRLKPRKPRSFLRTGRDSLSRSRMALVGSSTAVMKSKYRRLAAKSSPRRSTSL